MHEVGVLEPEPRRHHAGVASTERYPSHRGSAVLGVQRSDEVGGVSQRLRRGQVSQRFDAEVTRGLGCTVEPVLDGDDQRATVLGHLAHQGAVHAAGGDHVGCQRRSLAPDTQERERVVGCGVGFIRSRVLALEPFVVEEVPLPPRAPVHAGGVEMVERLLDPSRGRRGGRGGRGSRAVRDRFAPHLRSEDLGPDSRATPGMRRERARRRCDEDANERDERDGPHRGAHAVVSCDPRVRDSISS